MSSPRRFGIVVSLVLLIWVISIPPGSDRAVGQPFKGDVPVDSPAVQPAVLPTDRQARRRIEAAEDYVKAKDWAAVVRIVQPLLETVEDVLIPDPRQKDDRPARWVSLRGEADRILMGLPEEGRKYYEHIQGQKAAVLLKTAREANDVRVFADVAQRYAHTSAGAQALDHLATAHLDRGQTAEAAECYRWLLRQPIDRLEDHTLFRACLAVHLANDAALEEKTWKRLSAQAPNGVKIGEKVVGLESLRQEMRRVALSGANRVDWTQLRADTQRSGQQSGDMPLLRPSWRTNTAGGALSREYLMGAAGTVDAPIAETVPMFHPLAIGDRIICRGHGGIDALDLSTGRPVWHVATPLGLDGLLSKPATKVTVDHWLPQRADARALIRQNSALGTLSSDGNRVYAVEDLALPPPPALFAPASQPGGRAMGLLGLGGGGIGAQGPGVPEGPAPAQPVRAMGPLKDYFYHNKLRAIDLASGRVLWETGGRGGKSPVNDAYFFGPPLPSGGLLYAVYEKKGDVRLACLHPNTGQVLWTQLLASTRDEMLFDPTRRCLAAPPALADGILICPTNCGALVGIDLLGRRLAWAFAYPRRGVGVDPTLANPATGEMPLATIAGPLWQAAAPVIHRGKVIYTPPDADVICCVNLRDGEKVWQAARLDDLYLGGVENNRVLLVGRNACRALDLADGREVWQQTTGQPSGVGVASSSTYYLPLRKGAVVALEIETGRLLAAGPGASGEVPGNLIFHQGAIVSQTSTEIVAYPQVTAKLAELDKHLSQQPADSEAQLERASLRLSQGQPQSALTDLRAVLARQVAAPLRSRARGQLYEALAARLRNLDKPAEREALFKEIAQEWQALVDGDDVTSAEHFAALFGDLAPFGPEARLRLAEWWLDGKTNGSGLEAELHLLRLRDQREDPRLAARAVDDLARLYARKGLLEEAVDVYRTAGRDDHLSELTADKRFLPTLDDSGYAWRGGRIKGEDIVTGRSTTPSKFIPIEPLEGEQPYFLRRFRLGVNIERERIVLLDRTTGAEVWAVADPSCRYWRDLTNGADWSTFEHTIACRARGHLVLVGLGSTIVGLDLLNRRLLWSKSVAELHPGLYPAGLPGNELGPLGAGCATWRFDTGLHGLDPLNGAVLWSRADVGPNAQMIGDDEHIYLLEYLAEGMNQVQRANRAIRLRDGTNVKVPDFLSVWQGHSMGRYLLASAGAELWLHDPLTGRRIWQKRFSSDIQLLNTHERGLVGVLKPGGKLSVLDFLTGRVLMTPRKFVDPDKHEKGSEEYRLDAECTTNPQLVTLMRDRLNYYLVVASVLPQGQNEPEQPNIRNLSTVPSGGNIYAFDRQTGVFRWKAPTLPRLREEEQAKKPRVHTMHLLLERFDDLPVLVLGVAKVRQQQPLQPQQAGQPGSQNEIKYSSATVVIDKITGNWRYNEIHNDRTRPFVDGIHGDPRAGEIEIVSGNRAVLIRRLLD
jgi:outer membrane protein assembly factor BamB/tetratricopeptide (TPR) repeat protein